MNSSPHSAPISSSPLDELNRLGYRINILQDKVLDHYWHIAAYSHPRRRKDTHYYVEGEGPSIYLAAERALEQARRPIRLYDPGVHARILKRERIAKDDDRPTSDDLI